LDDKTDPRAYVGPIDAGVQPATVRMRPPKALSRFYPLNPRSLEELGLSAAQLEAAVLKALFFSGERRGIDLARHLRLPLQLVEPILDALRRQKLVDLRGGSGTGFGHSNMIYALTAHATETVNRVLDHDRYDGPAPVPYKQWVDAVKAQSIRGVRVTRQMLTA